MSSRTLMLVRKGSSCAGQRTLTMPGVARSRENGLREGSTGRLLVVPRVFAVAAKTAPAAQPATSSKASAPEPAFYRKYTEALLRRYQRLSHLQGRVGSLLGRELLGGDATSYQVRSFDDVIIFCADVEKCLLRLQPFERRLLTRVVMQGYTQAESAVHLGISLRHCVVRYGEALDKLTGVFLETRILQPGNWCQEEEVENSLQHADSMGEK